MTIRVLKYDIRYAMPLNHKPLYVGEQDGQVYVWAEVDDDEPHDGGGSQYVLVGTGWPKYPNHNTYVGTVQMKHGVVWHIYRKGGC